ncbi:MAG TPA: cytochrome c3 family protein [Anaeromyxobacter sp.]
MTTLRPRLAVLAAAAALASCAHRAATNAPTADGRVADVAAPPKAAFEVYPPEEIAALKSPHLYKGKALCQRCHLPDLKLTNGPNALCRECHRFGHGNHPVEVAQKTAMAGDLPLLTGGKLACHTCHDPHQQKPVLRKPFDDLCQTCHKRH